ncbi:MAG: endonuclease domain-containing protein [Alcaligenaceae bacterium]|nr:MAG: endonuclease domain-containing protein [Alcaligenaceae bacterium]
MANAIARRLRKNLTPQEAKLWMKLRELKPLGFHFRRQAPIRHVIVDFVSFRDSIVIEVDGGQHNIDDAARSDGVRDAFLKGEGFRVLRFWNHEVDRELDAVMDVIVGALSGPTRPAKGPATSGGRSRPPDPTARLRRLGEG